MATTDGVGLMFDYREPAGWWGGGPGGGQFRSITQLILDGVLDYQAAALLWTALARRASLLITSSTPRTGKTTLLTALLDFLPSGVDRLFLRGWDEPFDFTRQFSALNSYLLVNKFSPGLPAYFWGPKTVELFDLLAEGWRLAGTIQGESLAAIAQQLSHRDVGLVPAALARIDLLVTLGTGIQAGRPWRRVTAIEVPEATPDGGIAGTAVMRAEAPGRPLTLEPAGAAALAARLGLTPEELARRGPRRAAYLEELVARQVVKGVDVRAALGRFQA